MEKPFLEIKPEQFSMNPFNVKPIDGYEIPKNPDTGELFPNCCNFHKSIYKEVSKAFQDISKLTNNNQKIIDQWWFKEENYINIIEKICKQLSYTEYLIKEHCKQPDWYEDITDYIEYNVESFGQPHVGLDHYLTYLKEYIEDFDKELTSEQKKQLVNFILNYYKPIEKSTTRASSTDLNILYVTYQRWLKIFPFELSFYFGQMKNKLEKNLPFLKEKPIVNRYTGIAKAKMHTRESLIEALINKTDYLLTHINGVTLYEMGLINDVQKVKLELIINSRKLKLKQGYKNNSPDEEHRYRKIIKEWFNDEKKFFDELTPLIQTLGTPKTENEGKKLSVKQIALIHAYEGKQITRKNADEIAIKYGYASKTSGEGLFQDYDFYCNPHNRKGKTTPFTQLKMKNKIALFESILEHLSVRVKQRAVDEINILKSIYETEFQ